MNIMRKTKAARKTNRAVSRTMMPKLIPADFSKSSHSSYSTTTVGSCWSKDSSTRSDRSALVIAVSGDEEVKHQRKRAWKRRIRAEANDLFQCRQQQNQQNGKSSSSRRQEEEGKRDNSRAKQRCSCCHHHDDHHHRSEDEVCRKKQWFATTMARVAKEIDRGATYKDIQRMVERHVEQSQKRMDFVRGRFQSMSV